MRDIKPNNLKFKLALLSLSLLLMSSSQVSAALPLMYTFFSGFSRTAVETLITIPNIGIVVGLLGNQFLIRILQIKGTVIIGLVMVLIAGTFPIYCNFYGPLLLSRFLLGLGIGLFNSLAVSLLYRFYQKSELDTMLGLQNATSSIGAAVFSFTVSYLINFGWHSVFWIYICALPILILFGLVIVIPATNSNAPNNSHLKNFKINSSVIEIIILMFFIHLFFLPISFKLPQLVLSEKIGNMSQVAMISGVTTLMGIPVGIIYGKMKKHLRQKTLLLGIFLQTIGIGVVAYSINLLWVFIGVFLAGSGFGIAVPDMYDWLGNIVSTAAANITTTMTIIAVNLGCFVSPAVINYLNKNLANNTPRTAMIVDFEGMVFLLIYICMRFLINKKKSLDN